VPNEIKALAAYWDELFTARMGSRYPFNNGKDAKLLKDLLALYGDETVRKQMEAFFEMDDPFFEQAGYGIGTFRACLPKVLGWIRQQQPKADINGHVPPCKSVSDCYAKVSADSRKLRAV
jgi:hypothetical protein